MHGNFQNVEMNKYRRKATHLEEVSYHVHTSAGPGRLTVPFPWILSGFREACHAPTKGLNANNEFLFYFKKSAKLTLVHSQAGVQYRQAPTRSSSFGSLLPAKTHTKNLNSGNLESQVHKSSSWSPLLASSSSSSWYWRSSSESSPFSLLLWWGLRARVGYDVIGMGEGTWRAPLGCISERRWPELRPQSEY